MNIPKLALYGIYIKPNTYFKLMYIIYADDEQKYGIVHTAVFGMN